MKRKRKFQVIYAKTIEIEDLKQGDVFQIVPAQDEDSSCPKGLFQASTNGVAGHDTIEAIKLHLSKNTPQGNLKSINDLVFLVPET